MNRQHKQMGLKQPKNNDKYARPLPKELKMIHKTLE